ncbi:hypothetical protein C0Q88_08355 [Ralstonia pickettii]|uniref:Uncharacterized protein n=1 Tax=Ralstonia pickettii TaxID=329 RepID=A0A2N4TY94_RALPI|nr:hypothetical protein C0Q88_08355 [Ralstonia pickettii]
MPHLAASSPAATAPHATATQPPPAPPAPATAPTPHPAAAAAPAPALAIPARHWHTTAPNPDRSPASRGTPTSQTDHQRHQPPYGPAIRRSPSASWRGVPEPQSVQHAPAPALSGQPARQGLLATPRFAHPHSLQAHPQPHSRSDHVPLRTGASACPDGVGGRFDPPAPQAWGTQSPSSHAPGVGG